MLATTRRILQAEKDDEFILVIIYGALRYGKSSLACQILAEVYGTWEIDVLSKYIGFHPKNVLEQWASLAGEKQKAYLWDDAGLWLNALDWNSPFVRSVGKYLNVAGTDWACLILTAPLPTYITKKIRGVPQALTLRVRKVTGDPRRRHMREATAYRYWIAPDMRHSGVHKEYVESYSKYMPDKFFEWYAPLRKSYANMAKKLMRVELKTLDISRGDLIAEAPIAPIA